ncbi:MAG: biotin transporter BioY [Oscillospiraceae bacterium]|nr:biotin transporter BioY [Oscillospiraceae bacterium]
MKKTAIRDICFIGIFAAVIAVMAQISFPTPFGVPLTMQTFALMFAGIILGYKKGVTVALVYILLGALGVPVFAGFRGGFAVVSGTTGGFIMTFPLIAVAAGFGEKLKSKIGFILCLIAGLLLNYLGGLLWYSFVMQCNLQTAFMACILPYLPMDPVKIAAAAVTGKQIKKALIKSKVLI